MTKKYTLNKADLIKIAQAFGFSLASAALTFAIMVVEQVDFAEYAFVVPIINTILYGARKFVEGE